MKTMVTRQIMPNPIKIFIAAVFLAILAGCGSDDSTPSSITSNTVKNVTFTVARSEPSTRTFSELLGSLGINTTQQHATTITSTTMSKALLRVRNDIRLVHQMIDYRLSTGSAVTCTNLGDNPVYESILFGEYTNGAKEITIECAPTTVTTPPTDSVTAQVVIFDRGIAGGVHTYEFFANLFLKNRTYSYLSGFLTISGSTSNVATRPFFVHQLVKTSTTQTTKDTLVFDYLQYDINGTTLTNGDVRFAIGAIPTINPTLLATELLPGDNITGSRTNVVNPGTGTVNLPYIDIAANSRQYQVAESMPTLTLGFDSNQDGTIDSVSGIDVGDVTSSGLF